jgi:hypothetical protein
MAIVAQDDAGRVNSSFTASFSGNGSEMPLDSVFTELASVVGPKV